MISAEFDLRTKSWHCHRCTIISYSASLFVIGLIMVIRQWHFASCDCDWLYEQVANACSSTVATTSGCLRT